MLGALGTPWPTPGSQGVGLRACPLCCLGGERVAPPPLTGSGARSTLTWSSHATPLPRSPPPAVRAGPGRTRSLGRRRCVAVDRDAALAPGDVRLSGRVVRPLRLATRATGRRTADTRGDRRLGDPAAPRGNGAVVARLPDGRHGTRRPHSLVGSLLPSGDPHPHHLHDAGARAGRRPFLGRQGCRCARLHRPGCYRGTHPPAPVAPVVGDERGRARHEHRL